MVNPMVPPLDDASGTSSRAAALPGVGWPARRPKLSCDTNADRVARDAALIAPVADIPSALIAHHYIDIIRLLGGCVFLPILAPTLSPLFRLLQAPEPGAAASGGPADPDGPHLHQCPPARSGEVPQPLTAKMPADMDPAHDLGRGGLAKGL